MRRILGRIPKRLGLCILIILCAFTLACPRSTDTVRHQVVVNTDRIGNAIDAGFGVTKDSYAHNKISAATARSVTEKFKTANEISKRAGERVLAWVKEVDAQKAAAEARGEKFVEPTTIPEDVRADVRRLLDEIKATLRDIGTITDNRLLNQIAEVIGLVDEFYQLVKEVV